MKRLCKWLALCLLAALPTLAGAQEYTGISGLMQVPSAEINPTGTARVGGFFLNREFLPDVMRYKQDGISHKYHSYNHFLAIAPFSWMEIAYTCTLLKGLHNGHLKYHMKDRYISLKVRPLKEGKYLPAIALGANDPYHFSDSNGVDYYQCFYAVATKHLQWGGHELGVHAAWRWYKEPINRKWQGVVGGISYRPAFAHNLRAMVEYTGDGVNVGADCYLWKLLFLQACLQDGKYLSGGLMLQVKL